MRPFTLGLILLAPGLFPAGVYAQSALQARIAGIAADAHGTVSVACFLPGATIDCDLNPHSRSPMQSVFKLPLAMTVLHLADTGKLLPEQQAGEPLSATLARPIRFLPQDRIPDAYSPLQDRYPDANVEVSLGELIRLSAGESDNVATDILLRLAGGPSFVQQYIRSLGVAAFQLQDSEHTLHQDWSAQYRNWIEPAAAVQLLELLAANPPLSAASNAFLLQTITSSMTGPHRLRAGLPPGTVLAHKTGTSGEEHGIAAATNDIGLITMPDGRRLAIAVFVTDARADEATRDRVIAGIARAAYEEALHPHESAHP